MASPQVLQETVFQQINAPANTVAPAVTGNKWVGQTLSCTAGTWTGDTSGGFAYQWKDAGGNIASATSSTYVIAGGEAAASIHCTVTATGTGGSTAQDSNTVGPIGFLYAPTYNSGKVDVCANSTVPIFTPGNQPGGTESSDRTAIFVVTNF